MRLFPVPLLLIVYACGCSALPQIKRPSAESKPTKLSGNSPMSQLGVALPAMKPGDDRELKIIAAEQMTQHGYWIEAIDLYLEAESMAPKKPKLNAQLAPALAVAGRYPESLQRYRALIGDNPKDAKLINNFAFTLQESGDLIAAEAEFRKALSIDPDFENAAVNLGLMLARQQRYDEAFPILRPAIGESAAHHNLGVIAIECGDDETAKLQFCTANSLPEVSKLSQEFLIAMSQDDINTKPASKN